ncbi:hypothetical protein P280DRAFT_412585 [Massarina eburnea CBS 473.64]|uniref:Zn(2)-C6 fungal-type domain-containing protein n=1 Tax=Massarina eburnea CBS 473.64 TaxID=1395130 RepID=A0A6A6RI83_9PLEO|nr:hypothetical protein P280DRAFT_412585 [Massarina eburnea CBS 473.64]
MDNERGLHRGKPQPSPPNHQVQQEFLFVDAAKAKSSRQGRRNARSFVMQKARKERPWSTSKRTTKQRKSPESRSPTATGARTPDLSHTPGTSTPSPPLAHAEAGRFPFANPNGFLIAKQELCSECQVFRCQSGQHSCPKCLIMRAHTPPEDLDNSLFDPFGSCSVDTHGEVSILLDHFITSMAPAAIAVDIQKKSDLMRSQWFGTAVSNLAFMHSLLGTAAMHQFYCGRGSLDLILYHRMKAVTAINLSLSSMDYNESISDANVGAVFNLMTLEETLVHIDRTHGRDDQTDQRKVHYQGLRRMIQMRGGLLALGSNRILQAFILWHSTAHAMASFDVPYLSSDDLISVARNPRHPPGYRPNISQHLLDCCGAAQVRESLTTIVKSVLILIADLNALFDDSRSLLDPVDIQNYACALQCMLLQWLRDNENIVSPSEDALCVSLLIFTVRTTEAFRFQADTHPFHMAAIKKLEKALSATSRSEWQSCPDLLLYMLAIGAVSAEGSVESSWFVHQISIACSEYGIQDGETLLMRLHICGWVGFKLGEAVRHLWERMTRLSIRNRLEPPLDESSTVGPLQVQVASPDFTDWQNIDWPPNNEDTTLGSSAGSPSLRGHEALYDFGSGFVSTLLLGLVGLFTLMHADAFQSFPHNNAFYVR